MPLFSIIVPVYNVEKFLNICVDSILKQTFRNFELILVNDGSSDGCGSICDRYENIDRRVKVIHKSNGGLVSARNAGVEIAGGQYIGYVDGDDWVSEDWLMILSDIISKSHPDVISYNAYKSIDGKNTELKTSNFKGYFNQEELREQIIPYMLYDRRKPFYSFGVLPAIWAKVVKAEILIKNICKDENITFGEDTACTYNCILDSTSFEGTEEYLYYYRQNSTSMTKAYDINRFQRLDYLFNYLDMTLVEKEPKLKEQYYYYKAFCLFYAVLNEAKSKDSLLKIAKVCQEQMKKYRFQKYTSEFNGDELSLIWKCFLKGVQYERYYMLGLVCKIVNKIKYSYRE